MGGKAASRIIGGITTAIGVALMFVPGMQPIGAALIGAGLGTIGASFMPTPGAPSFAQVSENLRHTFRGAVTPHRIIYGQIRVSGPLYELGSTGLNNEYLHVIVPLAGHEINSIGNIIVNDILMDGNTADPKYAPYIRVNRHLGGPGQVADPDLIAELKNQDGTPAWSAAHVGNGIAYVYIRFKYSADIFPSGIKNIQADVQGKKLFDPRTSTTYWTDNWALCVRDYLTESFGLGLTTAEIDDDYFIAAANLSEEILATSDGGSQNRYTCNGAVDLSQSPTSIISSMLTAGAGHLVPLVEGSARLIPGAYSTPTVNLNESHLRDAASYQARASRKSLFNTVIGKYAGEETDWKVLNYPQVGVQAYVDEDGAVIKKEIELPFCTDHERCQRISMMVLKRHRASGILNMPCKLSAIEAATMEVVNITLPSLGFVNKTFRVTNWELTKNLEIDLTLKEDYASVYAWSVNDATLFTPLPVNRTQVPPPPGTQAAIPVRVNGLELQGQGNNTVFTGADANFAWRHITALDFQNFGSEPWGAGGGTFDSWFMGYEITIGDINGVVRTDFTTSNTYTYSFIQNSLDQGGPRRDFYIEVRIKGGQAQLSQPAKLVVSNPPPALPSGLSFSAAFQTAYVDFAAPTELDYVGVEVYMHTQTGFTPGPLYLVYDGPGTNIPIGGLQSGVQYFMKLRPYDVFGRTGLNESSELAATTQRLGGADLDNTPPTAPGAPGLVTAIEQAGLTATATVTGSWAAASDPGGLLSGYNVQYWDTAAPTLVTDSFTTSLSYTITGAVPGHSYDMKIQAVDWAGNTSAWVSSDGTGPIVAAGDTTPAGIPTGLGATAGLDKIIVSWTNPVEANFLITHVYMGATAGFVPNDATNLVYAGRGDRFIYADGVAGTNYYFKAKSLTAAGVHSAASAAVGPVSPATMTAGNIAQYIANGAIGTLQVSGLDAGDITTGTLAAGRIGANTIDATHINVTNLSAISANMGTITAGTITGGTIRTAASGARVELVSAGIRAWNATTQTVGINIDGSGFLGLTNPIQWDAAGVVTIPGELISGIVTTALVRTASTGWRVEVGPVAGGGRTNLIRAWNGTTESFWVDDAGNAHFTGDINATSGTFSGTLNAATGSFAGDISAATGTFGGQAASIDPTGAQGAKLAGIASGADNTSTVIAGGLVATGNIILGTGGAIRSGKTSYASTASGFWLGTEGGLPKFHLGNATESIYYDGVSLVINGFLLRSVGAGTIPLVSGVEEAYAAASPTMVKLREFKIVTVTGTVRVDFEVISQFVSYWSIYKNGIAVQNWSGSPQTWTGYTVNVAVTSGDTIELWGRGTPGYAGFTYRNMVISTNRLLNDARTL